ncbi:hypothetical protein [Mycolicibacillus koreensis]|uniref:Uncharacterized protein n=1 Tax=Mycolicibacillus koreensis TaxID=1069220 RepID=A0A7I7SDG1_9MYCO|nr:hypothetical protein [Mycolicibacillus koreensis]OSC34715.1 hypothetical protein B8W67_05555 [Mycolicibacillus koreensis]BBY54146.1 hypothetical protein MKOR_13970 [Mycolicibacillus koreensis]
MRYNQGTGRLELTERNVISLLNKLDDPRSARTLVCNDGDRLIVTAYEDHALPPHPDEPIILLLTRTQLEALAAGRTVRVRDVDVVPVADEAHYGDRDTGPVYMPSSGECR